MAEIINSGILILSILLMRKLTENRISSKYHYALWLFPAVYLLLSPFLSYESGFNTERLLKQDFTLSAESDSQFAELPIEEPAVMPSSPADGTLSLQMEPDPGEKAISRYPAERGIRRWPDWRDIRIIGSIFLAAVLAAYNIRFAVACRKMRIFYKRDRETGLRIYLLDGIASPFLLGRAVYLAPWMTGDCVRLRYMILHEYCHYKQGDLLWNLLRYLCLILYWYNPFLYLAAGVVRRDCELSCDERVIAFIGGQGRTEYGKTLLALLAECGGRKRKIGTMAMTGRGKKQMKERIRHLADERKNSKIIAAAVILATAFLTLCGFAREGDTGAGAMGQVNSKFKEVFKLPDPASAAGAAQRSRMVYNNNYNNYCRAYGEYFYYPGKEHLYRIHAKTMEYEIIADGRCRLGSIDGGYLYYLSLSGQGIMRINLDSLREEMVLAWDEKEPACANIFVFQDEMYLEAADNCLAYKIVDGRAVPLPEEENPVMNKIRELGIADLGMNQLTGGYCNSFFLQEKLVWIGIADENRNQKLYICDVEDGSPAEPEILDNYKYGVLVTDKGVLYTGTDEKIWLKRWERREPEILYEEGGLNYGTYNKDCLFVFREDGESVECLKLTYEGELSRIAKVDDVKRSVRLLFSAFDGYACFCDNGRIRIVDV